jgi:KamA family protein
MNYYQPMRLRFYTSKDLDSLPQLHLLSREHRQAMRVVAQVLPFRVNNHVVNELIDWDNVPEDPLFQLTFPQPEMLQPEHFARMARALEAGLNPQQIRQISDEIRLELNPHPGGQRAHNVPRLNDEPVPGVQHKYPETSLVFPSAGQTCHAYCTFCFRWAQFVGMNDLKFATDEAMRFRDYLRQHREITDVLLTGGDPMVMRTEVLRRYLDPLLDNDLDHIQTIRIGTKSLSYWPYRYLSDDDSEELLELLETVVASGKHLAIMAHFNHYRELQPPAAQNAIRRLVSLGAVIRTQSPLIGHVNDHAAVWARMWKEQVRLGCVPYYLFIERDTGARGYFRVPLARTLDIYREALVQNSGLGRSARGPTMSALPGKVVIDGVAEMAGQQVFVLSFLQARDPSWCKRPFFAQFDPQACWLSELRPAFGEREFFYERQLGQLLTPSRTHQEPHLRTPMALPRTLSLV